jgi:type I restriction enzyme M protein
VQDILDNFEFRNQIPRLSKADALGTLIEKFLSPDIDLSPRGLDNHGMGTVFEELDLRDTEQVPLLEEGGIDALLRREVLPYARS